MSIQRAKRFTFTVTVASSPAVSEEYWREYIRDAILGWAGGHSDKDKLYKAMNNDNLIVKVDSHGTK